MILITWFKLLKIYSIWFIDAEKASNYIKITIMQYALKKLRASVNVFKYNATALQCALTLAFIVNIIDTKKLVPLSVSEN